VRAARLETGKNMEGQPNVPCWLREITVHGCHLLWLASAVRTGTTTPTLPCLTHASGCMRCTPELAAAGSACASTAGRC
jgi:hypothetical protein